MGFATTSPLFFDRFYFRILEFSPHISGGSVTFQQELMARKGSFWRMAWAVDGTSFTLWGVSKESTGWWLGLQYHIAKKYSTWCIFPNLLQVERATNRSTSNRCGCYWAEVTEQVASIWQFVLVFSEWPKMPSMTKRQLRRKNFCWHDGWWWDTEGTSDLVKFILLGMFFGPTHNWVVPGGWKAPAQLGVTPNDLPK